MYYRLCKVFELRLVLTGEKNFQDCLLATLDSCIHLHYASTVQGNAIHNGLAVVQVEHVTSIHR